jgi:hypothetical protein
MKNAILILVMALIGWSQKMSANLIYFCHKGLVEIWYTNENINPITGIKETSLHFCCMGGGCPKGDFWIISVPNRIIANQPNWNETELSDEEYDVLTRLNNGNGYVPTVEHKNEVMAKYLALKDNPTYHKWIDPMRLSVAPFNTEITTDSYEIYALTVTNQPNTDKKIYFNVRSNTGGNIAVELTNVLNGSIVKIENISLSLGQNTKYINIPANLSGTFVVKFISTKNSITRTIVVN